MTQKLDNDKLLSLIIEGIENVKGENITLLDLREIDNTPCDYFVICDGNSNTQVNAISGSIQKTVSKEMHEKPWHIEGAEQATWILMDYISVVVHIFQKETREFYNIEDLWGDAKTLNVSNN
ncbi:ribosome silencing factor [Avrilella dinanensis]|uniref:ribosome silencing factor n=1 Tax=Avrilella dinanensis TaxID=2008672 RepID=UPI002409155A|nr:ribosome silencing factor [Avrilella dinanensis]